MLSQIGKEGQVKLHNAKVLIVGVGGLGSPISLYLTAAGVGTIGLIDADIVSESNLQRQVLFTEAEIGLPKVEQAKTRLLKLNSSTNIITYNFFLNLETGDNIIPQYDIVIDACDNMATRYVMNSLCEKYKIPYIFGAIGDFYGQISVFHYGENPRSLNDIFPMHEFMDKEIERPILGVIGSTPAVIGSLQANEAIKIICSFGEILNGKLYTINLENLQSNILEF